MESRIVCTLDKNSNIIFLLPSYFLFKGLYLAQPPPTFTSLPTPSIPTIIFPHLFYTSPFSPPNISHTLPNFHSISTTYLSPLSFSPTSSFSSSPFHPSTFFILLLSFPLLFLSTV